MVPAILILLSVSSLHPAPRRDSSVQKTWTNDAIESLRAFSPISVFNPPSSLRFVAISPNANGPVPTKAPYVKELDPDWYATEIGAMQAQVAISDAVIQRIQ